jgi:PleD family two-component response regulator
MFAWSFISAKTASSSGPRNAKGSQTNILVADDDAVSRRVLEATLRRVGHGPTVATNRPDALELHLRLDGPRLVIRPSRKGAGSCS